ncbi:uncharacterized protein [Lepisosteus oculatus]|uniref:uncharacterized protein n=1 Tax=Lepisosteus oculatus TaxID=7918 RepID=UPI0037143487
MDFGWALVVGLLVSSACFFESWGAAIQVAFLCTWWWFGFTVTPKDSLAETSTQTDAAVETLGTETEGEESMTCIVETDSRIQALCPQADYPVVKTALRQVFQCVYAQFILAWYDAPEDGQPLYEALQREFDLAVEYIIARAWKMETCVLCVGSLRILTQHLKNTKQKERRVLFPSRAEELAVLRTFASALVRNLLPAPFWRQECIQCVLNEIVALKVLQMLVRWFSAPDNLNQLVVSCLDTVLPQSAAEERASAEPEECPGREDHRGGETAESADSALNDQPNKKKKGQKIKEHLSKVLQKLKPKDRKKRKTVACEKQRDGSDHAGGLEPRSLLIQTSQSAEDLEEQSTASQDDSCSEGTELETDSMDSFSEDMMEFKLPYEMWCVGSWKVTVTEVLEENQELIFTVHLEEKDNADALQWDVRKSLRNFQALYHSLQETPNLPSISDVLESKEQAADAEVREKMRAKLEEFLQELVSKSPQGSSQEVFQFLCPFEKLLHSGEPLGGMWDLLCSLVSFFTPPQEEEGGSRDGIECPNGVPQCLDGDSPGVGLETDTGSSGDVLGSCPASLPSAHTKEPADSSRNRDARAGDGSARVPWPGGAGAAESSHSNLEFRELRPDWHPGQADLPEPCPLSKRLSVSADALQRSFGDGPTAPFKSFKMKKASRFPRGPGRGPATGEQAQESKERNEKKGQEQQQNKTSNLDISAAVCDLLKEMGGNIFVNLARFVCKLPVLNLEKNLDAYFRTLNLTEARLASYIDTLREKQWPAGQPAGPSPGPSPAPERTAEQRAETKQKARELLQTKVPYLKKVLNKSDVDAILDVFQNEAENKKLVYMLLSFLLRKLVPEDPSLKVPALSCLSSPL